MANYLDAILPLALQSRTFTYAVPEQLRGMVQVGMRIEVPFGKSKHYSAVVFRMHDDKPAFEVKEVIALLDEVAITTPTQMALWNWMSDYYLCTLGEVMTAALPGNLKLTSETRILYNIEYGEDFNGFSDDEYLVAEAVLIQKEITIEDARKITGKTTVFPVIQSLMKRGVVRLREELIEKFTPKKVHALRLCEPYKSDRTQLEHAFELLAKSERQQAALLAFLSIEKNQPYVLKQEIVDKVDITDAVLEGLRKKGILESYHKAISRLGGYEEDFVDLGPMSEAQTKAYAEVKQVLGSNRPCLLHGVTGAGKTRLYVELIREKLALGRQVLYLVPEIALTTQLIQRLQRVFGNDVIVYHSKVNYNERVEIYKAISQGGKVILSARSGIFLPFHQLGLIIVDEEHESSFKQFDPSPRYHARDAAIVLAHLSKADILLGTGTPSLESYQNTVEGKYGMVKLSERFAGMPLPQVEVIDLRDTARSGKLKGPFSLQLIEGIEACLEKKEQVILFQNLRGYAPVQDCQNCGWSARCINCEVSLTYHKGINRLKCHYCGYHTAPVPQCPKCKSTKVVLHGYGTERLEDDLTIYLPKAKIARMDYDMASSRTALEGLLHDFEEKRIEILVGTQMVTKGLDFDHVGLVGIISADQLLKVPSYRAAERAWQMMVQVSGRAGRKHKQGNVLIQTWQPEHPVIKEVLNADFEAFALREMEERKRFRYPPYYRLIHLTLRHKDDKILTKSANLWADELKKTLGARIFGPTIPGISRVRGYYIRQILIKMEKDRSLIEKTKALIQDIEVRHSGMKQIRQTILSIDVDPL